MSFGWLIWYLIFIPLIQVLTFSRKYIYLLRFHHHLLSYHEVLVINKPQYLAQDLVYLKSNLLNSFLILIFTLLFFVIYTLYFSSLDLYSYFDRYLNNIIYQLMVHFMNLIIIEDSLSIFELNQLIMELHSNYILDHFN